MARPTVKPILLIALLVLGSGCWQEDRRIPILNGTLMWDPETEILSVPGSLSGDDNLGFLAREDVPPWDLLGKPEPEPEYSEFTDAIGQPRPAGYFSPEADPAATKIWPEVSDLEREYYSNLSDEYLKTLEPTIETFRYHDTDGRLHSTIFRYSVPGNPPLDCVSKRGSALWCREAKP